MFEKGVNCDEILLQKYVNVDEQYFFLHGKKRHRESNLPIDQQQKIQYQVYTSYEMRKLWEQLFLYHSGIGHHHTYLKWKE